MMQLNHITTEFLIINPLTVARRQGRVCGRQLRIEYPIKYLRSRD